MLIGRIRNSNYVYKAPDNMEDCGDLHVQVFDDGETRIMTSAWYPTPEELDRLKTGQPIYLHIYGENHPVVAMTVPKD